MKRDKVITVRGRTLGGDTPVICAPLVGRTRERVLAEAANVVAKKPDVIEWRVDFFEAIGDTAAVVDTLAALRSAVGDAPIIFTRRSTKEGGTPIPLDDAGVVALYDAVGATGDADFLDFEMGNDAEHVRQVVATAHAQATRGVLAAAVEDLVDLSREEELVQRLAEQLHLLWLGDQLLQVVQDVLAGGEAQRVLLPHWLPGLATGRMGDVNRKATPLIRPTDVEIEVLVVRDHGDRPSQIGA